MTRALLERCRKELLSVVQSCNADIPHHDGDDFHELLRDVMTELVKPAPTQPAWHDAPTEAGLWLSSLYLRTFDIIQHDLDEGRFSRTGHRWFGPIPPLPEDRK